MLNINSKQLLLLASLAVLVYMSMVYFLPSLAKEGFINSVGKQYKVDEAMCRQECCAEQWPASGKKSKYAATNLTCTGNNGTGCVCLSKEQVNFLASRGGNH